MATVINRMRACADDCERFWNSGLGIGLRSTWVASPEGNHLEEMGRAVPDFLRFLADAAKELTKQYRKGDATRAEKAAIVAHVTLRTGRPHDREISPLMGVDTKSQEKWREENNNPMDGFMQHESAK